MLYDITDGEIIKDVYKTGISTQIADIATELINQIEYPVVFWLYSPHDRNYAANHSININQFWINVKKGTSLQERERIILKNLYMGVQKRKRYLRAVPKIIHDDKERNECLNALVDRINVISSNLECDFFLGKYGIKTAESETRFYYNDRVNKLKEYIERQKKPPGFIWYDRCFSVMLLTMRFIYEKVMNIKMSCSGL